MYVKAVSLVATVELEDLTLDFFSDISTISEVDGA